MRFLWLLLCELWGLPDVPPSPRVVPPVWASDDDLALLRKAGLL